MTFAEALEKKNSLSYSTFENNGHLFRVYIMPALQKDYEEYRKSLIRGGLISDEISKGVSSNQQFEVVGICFDMWTDLLINRTYIKNHS